MPVIIDKTVVASAYDTSGNGGRKIGSNSNDIFTVEKSSNQFFVQKRNKTTGNFDNIYSSPGYTSIQDVSIVVSDLAVYVIANINNSQTSCFTLRADTGAVIQINTLDSGQTALDKNTVAINDLATRIFVSLASKNATFPNSFNIRFAEGVIQADGSVVWGAVEKLSTYTPVGQDAINPSVIVRGDGQPSVIHIYAQSSNHTVGCYNLNGTVWSFRTVHLGYTYAQSSPSAIFVPKEINGLANGRIWVSWHGKDASDTLYDNVRVAYSDDGGITWSAMQKLTSGNSFNRANPSITATKTNKIFIVYANNTQSRIAKLTNLTGSWSFETEIKTATSNNPSPSTLFDLSLDIQEPLFIYKDAAKVGFYGTWTISNVLPNSQWFEDKDLFFSYVIETDGALVPITEKVNGTTIRTWTPTSSGDETEIIMTQSQFDAIRYGKYHKEEQLINLSYSYWESGGINTAIGTPAESSSAIRTKDFISVLGKSKVAIKKASNFTLLVFQYDDGNRLLVSRFATPTNSTDSVLELQEGTTKLKIQATRDDAVIILSPAMVSLMSASLEVVKYSPNTLTIEMGADKWEFPFTKNLAANPDFISMAKSSKDANEAHFPGVKSDLIEAVMGKGGVVTGDKWEDIEKAIEGIPLGVKKSEITLTTASSTKTFKNHADTLTSSSYLSLNTTVLGFTPKTIIFYMTNKSGSSVGTWTFENFYVGGSNYANSERDGLMFRVPYVNGIMDIPATNNNTVYTLEIYGGEA